MVEVEKYQQLVIEKEFQTQKFNEYQVNKINYSDKTNFSA